MARIRWRNNYVLFGCLHLADLRNCEAVLQILISFLLHQIRCRCFFLFSLVDPDVLKDLLLFIFLIKGLVCDLQTACAGIIFSISSAPVLIPLWALFFFILFFLQRSLTNPPWQVHLSPRRRCHHGDRHAQTCLAPGRVGWPEADDPDKRVFVLFCEAVCSVISVHYWGNARAYWACAKRGNQEVSRCF